MRRGGWSGRERSLVCARLLTTTEISPRGTRHHVAPRPSISETPLPTSRWTMGRPTIERIGVMERCCTMLADPRRAGERAASCPRLALRVSRRVAVPFYPPTKRLEI